MNTTCASPDSSGRISKRVRLRTLTGLKVAVALVALGGTAIAGPAFTVERERATPSIQSSESERHPGEDDQDYARRLFDQGLIVSLESVVKKARALRAGDLLEVELEHKHGRHVYEVEILDPHGQTWELKFDARDGRLLKEEREDH